MMIFTLQTDRKVQNAVLDKVRATMRVECFIINITNAQFPQLKWRERGLIRTVIDFREQPNLMFIYCSVIVVLVLLGGLLILVPFSHMLAIVLR